MAKTKLPHTGHNKHLCYLNNLGFQLSNPKEFRTLVKGAKFYCRICGRAAVSDKNLCKPATL